MLKPWCNILHALIGIGWVRKDFLMSGLMITISMTILMTFLTDEQKMHLSSGGNVGQVCTCLALCLFKLIWMHSVLLRTDAVMKYEVNRSLLEMSPRAVFRCWSVQLCQFSNLVFYLAVEEEVYGEEVGMQNLISSWLVCPPLVGFPAKCRDPAESHLQDWF